MKIWWCEEHEVSAYNLAPLNQMLCWQGWDVWCQSEGTTDPKCRFGEVPMRLIPDNAETIERIANAMWVEMLPGETQGAYVHRTAVAILAALDGETS